MSLSVRLPLVVQMLLGKMAAASGAGRSMQGDGEGPPTLDNQSHRRPLSHISIMLDQHDEL